jgi:triacylglycerol lipase
MNLVFASGFLLPQHVGPIEYFNGVRELVLSKGHPEPLLHKVPPLADSKTRSDELASAIRPFFPAGPIHIIAHSMGGLDSRYLIAGNLDLAERIVSLTMLSTPHHGSPLADFIAPGGAGLFSAVRSFIFGDTSRAIGAFGFIRTSAIEDLTKRRAEAAPNVAETHKGRIRFRSYAASGRVPAPPTSKLLFPGYEFILRTSEGGVPNDGAVAVESAKYGEFKETWACDHLDMVGHDLDDIPDLRPLKFDHITKFNEMIDMLQREHPGT